MDVLFRHLRTRVGVCSVCWEVLYRRSKHWNNETTSKRSNYVERFADHFSFSLFTLERLVQLFFIDVPTASGSQSPPTFASAFPASGSDSDEPDAAVITRKEKVAIKTTNRRKAAWYDPADEELTVSLKDIARLRKLRTLPAEDIVGGLEYESRLRKQCVLSLHLDVALIALP